MSVNLLIERQVYLREEPSEVENSRVKNRGLRRVGKEIHLESQRAVGADWMTCANGLMRAVLKAEASKGDVYPALKGKAKSLFK